MARVLFVHPDKFFLDFVSGFLGKKGFEVIKASDGGEAFEKGVKGFPGLFVINKTLQGVDLGGLLIKKKVTPAIKGIPVFLIGDFSSQEILKLKEHNVKAFLSMPLNIEALVERLNRHFKRIPDGPSKQTTMLFDMHSKGNILVIQIEGNFHPDKLEIMTFKLRSFFHEKKVKEPKVLFIFPSIYPESITKENFEFLFSFTKLEEFKIKPQNIKVLTSNKNIINMLRENIEYSDYEIVNNYYDGIQGLNISFNKKKDIPLDLLKVGTKCIFDLYDEEGDLRIPALSIISHEIKEYLLNSGLKKLTYFSEKEDDSDILSSGASEVMMDGLVNKKDSLMMEFEEVNSSDKYIEIVNEKLVLFLKKLDGQNVLIVSTNQHNIESVRSSLDLYINIDVIDTGAKLLTTLGMKKYLLVFIEHDMQNPGSYQMLHEIRKRADKRTISVVIIAKKINITEAQNYRKLGTDYILLTPFSDIKIIYKIFNALYLDRSSN